MYLDENKRLRSPWSVTPCPRQAVQQEENFFEKARRCVLRAIGVGRKSTHGRGGSSSRAGGSGEGGGVGGGGPVVAETAEEIELRHKIKVWALGSRQQRFRVCACVCICFFVGFDSASV